MTHNLSRQKLTAALIAAGLLVLAVALSARARPEHAEAAVAHAASQHPTNPRVGLSRRDGDRERRLHLRGVELSNLEGQSGKRARGEDPDPADSCPHAQQLSQHAGHVLTAADAGRTEYVLQRHQRAPRRDDRREVAVSHRRLPAAGAVRGAAMQPILERPAILPDLGQPKDDADHR